MLLVACSVLLGGSQGGEDALKYIMDIWGELVAVHKVSLEYDLVFLSDGAYRKMQCCIFHA